MNLKKAAKSIGTGEVSYLEPDQQTVKESLQAIENGDTQPIEEIIQELEDGKPTTPER